MAQYVVRVYAECPYQPNKLKLHGSRCFLTGLVDLSLVYPFVCTIYHVGSWNSFDAVPLFVPCG